MFLHRYQISLNTCSFLSQSFLLLCLISVPQLAHSQWNALTTPVIYESYMEVVNSDTLVYSYGNTGNIYSTFNGGETWSEFQTNLEYTWFFDFDFPTDQIGYGCGGTYFGQFNDVVIKTENAGLTWDTLTTNGFGVYTFNNIDFLNTDTGFVSGGTVLLRTEDAGLSFTPLEIVDEGLFTINQINCTSQGILFVAGYEMVSSNSYHISIFRSSDLGETWLEVYSDDMEDANNLDNRFVFAMHFPTAETGFACGGNGLFLKTTDAGLTWIQSFIDPFTNLSALNFTSVNVGYININDGIYKTNDGGSSWTNQNILVLSPIMNIQFGSENIGYSITGENIFKTVNGGDPLSVYNLKKSDNISIFPNPAIQRFSVINSEGTIRHIHLSDSNGKRVKSVSNDFEGIDLSGIAAGTYFLTIETNQGIVVDKLVVD